MTQYKTIDEAYLLFPSVTKTVEVLLSSLCHAERTASDLRAAREGMKIVSSTASINLDDVRGEDKSQLCALLDNCIDVEIEKTIAAISAMAEKAEAITTLLNAERQRRAVVKGA